MRRKLIEADVIECVLGLGPNLFYTRLGRLSAKFGVPKKCCSSDNAMIYKGLLFLMS